MDDLLTGHQTEEGLNRICRLITKSLSSACFNLRKFQSNANQLFVENKLNEVQELMGHVFVCSTSGSGEIHVQLLCSKSRIAPLQSLTIPKLELCGALLSAELGNKVTHSLRCTISRYVYWTDSMIVLGWLHTSRNTPKQLKIFVANRVNKINNLTKNCEWRYVPTEHNPADYISRGVDQMNNKVQTLWWNGPQFLSLAECHWPNVGDHKLNSMTLPEMKQVGS